jgi:predicted LPLAT superfamily acyltransferase
VGTVLGIRIVVALAAIAGRRVAGAFLAVLALYYALTSGRTRRASRGYLARVGQPVTFASVVRHVHTFARVALDRLFLLRGRTRGFAIDRHGDQHLLDLTARGAGAILLGSHLGSFEAMRAVGHLQGMRLSIVVDKRSAERLDRVLRELAPDAAVGVIPVDPDGVATALRVREAVRRGDLVGILADRTVAEEQRNVTVDFLGAPAELPAGPYLVAHALKCPVFTVFGLFSPPNRYEVFCEPFCEVLTLDHDARDDALRAHAQRYAGRLAHYAKRAPYNWFNFYDFWKPPALTGADGSDGSR